MRIRVHPHLLDLAGTGLVLLGLLLAALALSAAPIVVRALSGHPVQAPRHAPESPAPDRGAALT